MEKHDGIWGTDTAPNGMLMREAVVGWDLNNGRGFESFKEAKMTWGAKPSFGWLYKINGVVYEVIECFGKGTFIEFELLTKGGDLHGTR